MTEEALKSCKVNGIHLYPGNVEKGIKPFISLLWSGDIGWGEYGLVINKNYNDEEDNSGYELEIYGDSECMDKGERKDFLRQLLMSIADKVEVTT
jgi:hypothetical protein